MGAVYNSHIKPALKGEVDMSVSEWTEGLHRGCTWLRQPLSHDLRRASSPAGEPFGAVYNSHIKPALKGEVDMSVSEWTEGLHRGCTWLRQPLSHDLRRASSPAGEPFGALYKLPHKTNKGTLCVPSFLQSLMLIRRQADFAARISALTVLRCLQRRRVLWCRRP